MNKLVEALELCACLGRGSDSDEICDAAEKAREALSEHRTGGWMLIGKAIFDGRLALVYRPLAENSGDKRVTVKHLIGGNNHCWESTVHKGEEMYNPTDGVCHVTHYMDIPTPPEPEQ